MDDDPDRAMRERAGRFDLLFQQNVNAVFFTTFDAPIRWDAAADHEALLDYAFDHLRLTEVNEAMCAQLGAPRDRVIGTVPRDRWSMKPGEWREHMRQLFSQGHIHHTVRGPRGDGSWYDVEGEYVCTYDADGRITGHFGTQRDIGERKQLHDRLVASERFAALGRLAAGVGHEINNPLTYIVLNLTLIEREVAAVDRGGATTARIASLRGMIDQARYGAERVGAVVRDLKALTRPVAAALAILDPVAVVERCLQIADHQIKHRARVVRELGAVPAVLANEGRMVQLFLNLIVNAAQALPEGHADRYWIRITTATGADGRAIVEVTDNGPGIPAAEVDRIFDPFFTTKAAGEGSGLGLAISRTIVKDLGGDIDVETSVGHGTTFRVALPAAAPASAIPVRPLVRARPGAVPEVAVRVLVIDDEPMIGHLIRSVLGGHEVSVETSARIACDRLRAGERFDRILCDLMMPEVTGMDFYDELAAIAPEQRSRVVFLTGGVFTDRARRFLASVPNRRLEKPFDDADLAEAIRE